MKARFLAFWAWARPGYLFVAETAAELLILLWRGAGWLLRVAAAVLLFFPWVLYRLAAWVVGRRKGGGGRWASLKTWCARLRRR